MYIISTESRVLRYLPQVIEANLARLHPDENERQPGKLLKEITTSLRRDNPQPPESGAMENFFIDVLVEFSKRAGVYGYGDLQVRKMLNNKVRR